MSKPTISIETYNQIFTLLTAGLVRKGVVGSSCDFKLIPFLILIDQSIKQKKLFWQILHQHIEVGAASKVDTGLVPTYFRQLNQELYILVGNQTDFKIRTQEPLTGISVEYSTYMIKSLVALVLLSLGEIETLMYIKHLQLFSGSGTVYYVQDYVTATPYLCIVLGRTKNVNSSYGMIGGTSDIFVDRKITNMNVRTKGIMGYLPLPGRDRLDVDFTNELNLFNSKIVKYNMTAYDVGLNAMRQFDQHFWDGVVRLGLHQYRVNMTVLSAFSAFFLAAFTCTIKEGLRFIDFPLEWRSEFEQYLYYLGGQPSTMLNLIDFEANLRFADYIQDRMLGIKLLLVFFSNLDNIEMKKAQVDLVKEQLRSFIFSL